MGVGAIVDPKGAPGASTLKRFAARLP